MRTVLFLIAYEISQLAITLGANVEPIEVQNMFVWIFIVAMFMDIIDFLRGRE